MSEIDFIGKCMLLEKDNERVLAIADLHLGYEGSLRERGLLVPSSLYDDYIKYLDKVFSIIGGIDKIVIVGDLKHEIGKILKEEWKEVGDFLDYLLGKCKEIIVVKGNHDVIIEPVVIRKEIKIVNKYVWKDYCFIHGDKDFDELYIVKIKNWVMGHFHPAVNLKDGAKNENYKCFLLGSFKEKKVIILPSFFDMNEGSDPREMNFEIIWDFKFEKFDVRVVGENMRVLEFGKLKDL